MRIVCETCGKSYPGSNALKVHIRMVHGDKQIRKPCPVCHKRVNYLKKHLESHDPKQYVPCEQCGKDVEPRHMKEHIRNHHSGRKFTCEVCNKEFKLQSTLKVHKETHTGKRYKCYFCPFESTSTANRVKHHRLKHPVEYEASPLRKPTLVVIPNTD